MATCSGRKRGRACARVADAVPPPASPPEPFHGRLVVSMRLVPVALVPEAMRVTSRCSRPHGAPGDAEGHRRSRRSECPGRPDQNACAFQRRSAADRKCCLRVTGVPEKSRLGTPETKGALPFQSSSVWHRFTGCCSCCCWTAAELATGSRSEPGGRWTWGASRVESRLRRSELSSRVPGAMARVGVVDRARATGRAPRRSGSQHAADRRGAGDRRGHRAHPRRAHPDQARPAFASLVAAWAVQQGLLPTSG